MHPGQKAELRDGETIRAYLDELVRLKLPIQLWAIHDEDLPFTTRVERLSGNTFITAQTPPLQVGNVLKFAFLLDGRRFTATTEAMATGVFRVPTSISQGERREHLRADFRREAAAEVFAVERVSDSILGGRTLVGRLLDLSAEGLKLEVWELATLSGPAPPLKPGDRFAALTLTGLPYTPTLQCRGAVAHVTESPEGLAIGIHLEDLGEIDQKNLERMLEPRLPATFGQAFTKKRRKTDIADQVGAPTPTPIKVKPTEVVAAPVKPPLPTREELDRPSVTAIMKLRKIARKILVLCAAEGPGHAIAQSLRDDGFKQVFEVRSFMEAQALAKRQTFDLLVLDLRIGGHSGQDMVAALRKNRLLLETPIILGVDRRSATAVAAGDALGAVHLHERAETYEDLVPMLYSLLLKAIPQPTP